MTNQYDEKLISKIRDGNYSEKELLNLYTNALEKNREDIIEHIKLRLRCDFPRLANKLFGTKGIDAVEKLTTLLAEVSLKWDLENNKVGKRVKAGGDMMGGRKYLDYYISYKNSENIATSFGLVQDTVDSELQSVVRKYKTGNDSFEEVKVYGMEDYSLATMQYKQHLSQIIEGV